MRRTNAALRGLQLATDSKAMPIEDLLQSSLCRKIRARYIAGRGCIAIGPEPECVVARKIEMRLTMGMSFSVWHEAWGGASPKCGVA